MNTADHQLIGPVAPLARVAQAWTDTRTGARAVWLTAGVMVVIVAAGSAEPASTIVAGWCLLAAALVDVYELRLPNELLLTALAASVLGASVAGELAAAAIGALIAGSLLLWVRLQRGLGMGDVKMGAVVGASVAPHAVVAAPLAIAVAALAAASWALVKGRRRMPLGPALWFGWAVAWLLPEGWWR